MTEKIESMTRKGHRKFWASNGNIFLKEGHPKIGAYSPPTETLTAGLLLTSLKCGSILNEQIHDNRPRWRIQWLVSTGVQHFSELQSTLAINFMLNRKTCQWVPKTAQRCPIVFQPNILDPIPDKMLEKTPQISCNNYTHTCSCNRGGCLDTLSL